jgi:transposase-like protein
MTSRRKFTSEFKAKVVIEAIKERETLTELSHRFELNPMIISRWKKEFLSKSSIVFGRDKEDDLNDKERDIKALQAKVGELTMERDFLEDACKRAGLK